MASAIFNYSDDPPRVSSPWSTPRTSTPKLASATGSSIGELPGTIDSDGGIGSDADIVVTSLEAEPQEGPTEYKLHLLLRPRRKFISLSTGRHVSGSTQSTPKVQAVGIRTPPQRLTSLQRTSSTPTISNVSRQAKLTQLATQLLWRLEQSTSRDVDSHNAYHADAAITLDESGSLYERSTPLPSVESSMGALYEIGVADDGTLVGLAGDELDESLETLRIMAASLGCTVTVLRRLAVGKCEWRPEITKYDSSPKIKKDLLYVAEAYVRPMKGSAPKRKDFDNPIPHTEYLAPSDQLPTSQLRVTITGATMAGKSSLLGTLTTSTLDNGRGKSRMSLLRHQHEIVSGMTSSVTHEIIGFSCPITGSGDVNIINLASPDVNTWNTIHSRSQGGRVVLFSDSAGHPRYRRTTVRGLIGWSPHWTLLCIPADNLDDTTGRPGSTPPSHETLGVSDTDIDLSQEHLELCLKLGLALIVVITKKDLATRAGLRTSLNKVLSVIKGAGRQPLLIPDGNRPEAELSMLSCKDLESVRLSVGGLDVYSPRQVPILFTSALQGTGIRTLYALLHELPLPHAPPAISAAGSPTPSLFDIEEIFRRPGTADGEEPTLILSGILRHGDIHANDEVLFGPFTTGHVTPPSPPQCDREAGSLPRVPSHAYSSLSIDLHQPTGQAVEPTWMKARVTSIRHMRLATHTLIAGQVGTVAVSLVSPPQSGPTSLANAVRKGMVLTSQPVAVARSFAAEFARRDVDPLSIGSNVVVYFNSVRASARITAGEICDSSAASQSTITGDDDFTFQFGDDYEFGAQYEAPDDEEKLLVTFQFISTLEYVETGTKVLVMPGGGFGVYGANRGSKGVAGLSGFVGIVTKA